MVFAYSFANENNIDSITNQSHITMKTSKNKTTPYIFGGLVAVALAIGAYAFGSSQQDKTFDDTTLKWGENIYSEMEEVIDDRDALIDDMSLTFDKIDANLETIREKEASLRELQEGEEGLGSQEDRIVRDIQAINTLLEKNRNELDRISRRLRKSGAQVKGLKERIANMEAENELQTESLLALQAELAEKNNTIALMSDTLVVQEILISLQDSQLTENQDLIGMQDRQLHQAYFTTGTFKELRDRGLVEKKGDILGIGGKKTFTAQAPGEEFVQIDLREHSRIPVFAKKVEIVTPHPDGSFELEENEDGVVETIEITDPDEFWKASRYLVVATNQ